MPHPSLSSPNTTSRSSAPLASATCPTNMALFGVFFFLLLPPWEGVSELLGLGRGGGGNGGGLRLSPWRPKSKQSWAGRGRGCTFPVLLQQVGPNTGLDVSHDSLGQTGRCCTFTTVRTIVLKLGLQSLPRLIISRSSRLCFQLNFLQVKL